MVNKWVYYGLSIVFLLLVAAFVGWEFIPRWGNELSEQQRNFIETILMWSTVGLGVVLAVILVAGQLTGRGRSEKAKAAVPERVTLAAPAPASTPASVPIPDEAFITEPVITITPIIAPLDYPLTRTEDLQAEISGEAEEKEELLSWTEVITGNAQHIGAREEQQDSFSFSALDDPAVVKRYGILAVLADGMGGLAMGREASQLAVQAMLNEYTGKTAGEPVPVALERALHKANEEVYGLAKRHELEWSVGTTLIAAVIQEGQLYWISAGDSRIYLYRGGVLIPLTQDHVYANRLLERVKAGQMTREEAESHPERDLLTSYLGIPVLDEIDANRAPFALQAGDWVLLCSDGLYDDLSEQLLEEAVRLPPQHAAEFILQHVIAQQRQYQDNATIAILACL
ncbi:MAG: PP2C family protein-serine/threonine phosphatase [Bacillota bacterium]